MNDQRKKILLEYKNKTIEGISITLVPFNMNFAKEVVNLRNSERAHYYLNQNYTLSIESQRKWYEDYQNCENDLYWCILNNRHDNKNMNSISRKLKFIKIRSTLLRDIEYHQYELFPNNFKEEKLEKTLKNWKKM